MKENQLRVSIGVPVRNGEPYLTEALDSLLAQSYENFELLISDNASTDNTEAICREYVARDKRVQYHRHAEDVGLANNYNGLFERARGEYFKWAAADDVHEPEYVSRCLDELDGDSGNVLAYGMVRFIDQNGVSLPGTDPGFDLRSEAVEERFRYVLHANHWVNVLFGLMRRDALAKTRLMRRYPGADYALLGELALIGKFAEVREPLLRRRLHPSASSQNAGNTNWMLKLWTGSGGLTTPAWSRAEDHFMTIVHSGLGIREKLSLSVTLARTMVWRRRPLADELRATWMSKLRTKR